MASDILVDNKFIYNLEYSGLQIFNIISQIVFVLFIVGFFSDKPEIFLQINFVIKIVIALFLMYRFNSYRKEKITFTELDRKAIFSIAVYILLFSFFDLVQFYIEQIRGYVTKITIPVGNYIIDNTYTSMNI
jgi:hypothetical protein